MNFKGILLTGLTIHVALALYSMLIVAVTQANGFLAPVVWPLLSLPGLLAAIVFGVAIDTIKPLVNKYVGSIVPSV